MALAITEALKFKGITAPNPAVGACVIRGTTVLAQAGHEGAGKAHAEALAIERAVEKCGGWPAFKKIADELTLYVTLEPCNHQGRTGPCTQAILKSGIKRVVYGAADPNPQVQGNGGEFLRGEGLEVTSGILETDCKKLIVPFVCSVVKGQPFIIVKRAWRLTSQGEWSMLPELTSPASRTFTQPASLILAHSLRRESDAIVTAMGTVLADLPQLNIRHVEDFPDFPGRRKKLVIVLSDDENENSLPSPWHQWKRDREIAGLEVKLMRDFRDALTHLRAQGRQQALLELGPKSLIKIQGELRKLWHRDLQIFHNPPAPDFILDEFHCESYL